MTNDKQKRVPTLQEYMDGFDTPNYLGDPRTPREMISNWYRKIEDKYYELYGQEKIESLRPRKEGK